MADLSDIEVWSKTVLDEKVENPVIYRDSVYINDSNSGAYNGSITFDTMLLSSSGKWCNFNEAFIQIPFTFSMRSTTTITAANANAYMLGLKCGNHQLIHSMTVEYGNKQVVELTNNLNFFTQFSMLTKSSYDDIIKNGATTGFIPDSSGSYFFVNAASGVGDGYSNNNEVALDAERWLDPQPFNAGFRERRAKTTAFNAKTIYGGLDTMTEVQAKNVGKSYFTYDTVEDANRVLTWYALLNIRLKDVASFFENIPLVKNPQMKIEIRYNSCTTTITKTGAADADQTQVIASHNQLSGNTNPLMMGSCDKRMAGATATQFRDDAGSMYNTPAGTYTVTCGIKTNALSSSDGHTFTSCRLYVPLYKLSPIKELALLKSKPVTKFHYDDLYSFDFKVSRESSFNQILSNGIANAKYLVIIPFADGTVDTGAVDTDLNAGKTFANISIPVYQSIFDSAGGTTSPLVSLRDLQIQIAGNTVWSQNVSYDFLAFSEELAKINAVMGNIQTGETSGVISKSDFENAYRYYVCNLSHRESSEDLVPKSISVLGFNNTSRPLHLHCFVVRGRECSVETATGLVL